MEIRASATARTLDSVFNVKFRKLWKNRENPAYNYLLNHAAEADVNVLIILLTRRRVRSYTSLYGSLNKNEEAASHLNDMNERYSSWNSQRAAVFIDAHDKCSKTFSGYCSGSLSSALLSAVLIVSWSTH